MKSKEEIFNLINKNQVLEALEELQVFFKYENDMLNNLWDELISPPDNYNEVGFKIRLKAFISRYYRPDQSLKPALEHSPDEAFRREAPLNKDKAITEQLIGTWMGSTFMNGFIYDGLVSYAPEGKFRGETTVKNQWGYSLGTLYYDGVWNVINGTSILTIMNSNNQQYLRIGAALTSKIISITYHTCVFLDNMGIERTAQRVS